MILKLNMVQTVCFAVFILLIGQYLRKKIGLFQKFAIPAPVIGGILFAVINLILNKYKILGFKFDMILKDFFMIMFFTSIGFNASIKILKAGGKDVIKFLVVVTMLCVFQNIVAVILGNVVGLDTRLAFMTGSTPMTGGHGTAAGIAPLIEKAGAEGAGTIAITSATFGLIVGSILGGPVATFLINRDNLLEKRKLETNEEVSEDIVEEESEMNLESLTKGFFLLLIAMGVGSYVSNFLNYLISYVTDLARFPAYIGTMIIAILSRNLLKTKDKKDIVPNKEVQIFGDIALNIFLAMALMELELWQLQAVLGQMSILLLCQAILMALYSIFVTYRVMGSNYDAAVLAAGHCGFGMGATPNGVANMQSVTEKYEDSRLAFFVLPIVGGMFIDFTNLAVITIFLLFI